MTALKKPTRNCKNKCTISESVRRQLSAQGRKGGKHKCLAKREGAMRAGMMAKNRPPGVASIYEMHKFRRKEGGEGSARYDAIRKTNIIPPPDAPELKCANACGFQMIASHHVTALFKKRKNFAFCCPKCGCQQTFTPKVYFGLSFVEPVRHEGPKP